MTPNSQTISNSDRSTFSRAILRFRLGLKRTFDILSSLLLLILLSPLFLVVVIISAIRQGRPVWYSQVRIGRHGKPFQMHKFRTMSVDADERKAALADGNERDGPLFKIAEDPRVTPFGRFLRRTSLDELPQLFNVLDGTMTLVGPRPALPEEVEKFSPALRRREHLRQGITGSWQVEARSSADFSMYSALDLDYIDNWSLHKDLWILLRTPAAVVRHGRPPKHIADPERSAGRASNPVVGLTTETKPIAG
jgi:lipopolysaccharide/colanic/teichoic acid biosynthesis glycosyltransferase